MDSITTLLHDRPIIALHLASMLLALLVGAALLLRRKGNVSHRTLGWVFVAAMATAALSSAFIRDHKLPNVAGFTAIHLLTVAVVLLLPLGVWFVRAGRISGHRKTMTNLYLGACVVAGVFALQPGRLLGDLLWRQLLGLPI